MWAGKDSNLRRQCRQIYSLLPLAARAPTRVVFFADPAERDRGAVIVPADMASATTNRTVATLDAMPTFDVVSEVDAQEVRNAVDQAQREIANRFDFKNTNSTIEQNEMAITLHTVSRDRLDALRTVLEEKLVKRGVSLRGVDYGDIQDATQNTVRQVVTIKVGISSDKAKEINKLIKEKAPKGTSSQTQGESIRVSAKKRDALQDVIAMLKAEDVGIPLQFQNFRD
jgi:cyclic-di-GMP-binding protein